MTENQLAILVIWAILVLFVLVLGSMVTFLDAKVAKLSRDNKLLRRVLEDYFQLEDSSMRSARSIAREVEHFNWMSSGRQP